MKSYAFISGMIRRFSAFGYEMLMCVLGRDLGRDRTLIRSLNPVVSVNAGVSPIKLPRQDWIWPAHPVAAKVDEAGVFEKELSRRCVVTDSRESEKA